MGDGQDGFVYAVHCDACRRLSGDEWGGWRAEGGREYWTYRWALVKALRHSITTGHYASVASL